MTPGETGKALPNSPGRIRVSLRLLEKYRILSDACLPNRQLPKMNQHPLCERAPPKTNMAMEYQPLKTYLILKMLIFHSILIYWKVILGMFLPFNHTNHSKVSPHPLSQYFQPKQVLLQAVHFQHMLCAFVLRSIQATDSVLTVFQINH